MTMHDKDAAALEMFEEYQRAEGLSPATIRSRHSILTNLAKHRGSLVDLDVFSLRGFVGRDDPNVSKGSRRTERNAIRRFYRFMLEEGLRSDDPSERIPMIHVPRKEPRPFTREQIEAMLTSGAYTRTRAMILVGYHQGFRVSSIARVHGQDIDRSTNTISALVKGSKVRRVPLHPVISELSLTMPSDGYWFPSRKDPSRPMSSNSVTNLITIAKKRAGILDPLLTPHSLRHSFGSELVEADVDIRVVQELMMHEDITSTQVYTRVSERRKQSGIVALPSLQIPDHSGRVGGRWSMPHAEAA